MAAARRLGGWERVFVVASVVTLLAVAVVRIDAIPSPIEEGRRVYECDASLIALREPVTPTAAAQLVYNHTFQGDVSPGCLDALAQLADGRRQAAEWSEWRKWTRQAAGAAIIFLAALYLAGWTAGWVWRGFFPKKDA